MNRECPVCTKSLRGTKFLKSAIMNKKIKQCVAQMSPGAQAAYFRRFFRDAAWNDRRKPQTFKEGTQIDTFDSIGEWRPSIIMGTYRRSDGRVFVMVKTLEGPEPELLLPVSTLRIARRGFMTLAHCDIQNQANTPSGTVRQARLNSEPTPLVAPIDRRRSLTYGDLMRMFI